MKLKDLLAVVRSDKDIQIIGNTGHLVTLRKDVWGAQAYAVSPVASVCEEKANEIMNTEVDFIDDNERRNALMVFLKDF